MKGCGRVTICLLFVSSPDSTLRITITVAQVMLGGRGASSQRHCWIEMKRENSWGRGPNAAAVESYQCLAGLHFSCKQ